MLNPGRLCLLTTITLAACSGGDGGTAPPTGDPPAVAGTYYVTGESTNVLGTQFTFAGPLVLTQAGDPPGEALEGTLTLTYSNPRYSTSTAPLTDASVDGNGNLKFVAGPAAGLSRWTGSFSGTAIVNGRFGCDGCNSGVWRATRR